MTPSKKLLLNKESVRVLVSSDLAQVHGGHGKVSSALAPTATAVGGGKVSSAKPGGGGKVSSIRPTSTARGGGHKVSSVKPGGFAHPTATAVGTSFKIQ